MKRNQMKGTELKVGDWISLEGKPSKVYGIDPPSIYVEENIGKALNIYDNNITPITLTEEILEKNGWKEEAANDWWNKEIPILNLYYSNSSDMYVVYFALHYQADKDKIAEIHTIRYTHQLQHLLWALGMDDDLKI